MQTRHISSDLDKKCKILRHFGNMGKEIHWGIFGHSGKIADSGVNNEIPGEMKTFRDKYKEIRGRN